MDLVTRSVEEHLRDEEQSWEQHQEAAAAYLLGNDVLDLLNQSQEHITQQFIADEGKIEGHITPAREFAYARLDDANCLDEERQISSGRESKPEVPRDPEKWQKEYLFRVEKEHQENLMMEKAEEERLTREELSQSGDSTDIADSVTQEPLSESRPCSLEFERNENVSAELKVINCTTACSTLYTK